MRRVLVLVAAAVAVVALGACEPAPPTVGMTAKSSPAKPPCGIVVEFVGNTKGTATSSVVLQRTQGGKWVDWKWLDSGELYEVPHLLKAKPDSSGNYSIDWQAPTSTATLHLRVRSAGGTVVSNGVYVTPFAESPGSCG